MISRHHLLAMIALPALLGCGGGSELPDVPLGTVKGTVTFNGQAIPEGSVVAFTPEGGTGIPAAGPTSGDGSFQLRARNSLDIPTGIYKVSVNPPPPKQMTDEEAMKASVTGKNPDYKVKEIPDKYRNPQTSGEVFEVKEGANTFELDMKPAK